MGVVPVAESGLHPVLLLRQLVRFVHQTAPEFTGEGHDESQVDRRPATLMVTALGVDRLADKPRVVN